MEQGKIYYLDYGGNTQVVGRFKESSSLNHIFYDLLHYWRFSKSPREPGLGMIGAAKRRGRNSGGLRSEGEM